MTEDLQPRYTAARLHREIHHARDTARRMALEDAVRMAEKLKADFAKGTLITTEDAFDLMAADLRTLITKEAQASQEGGKAE